MDAAHGGQSHLHAPKPQSSNPFRAPGLSYYSPMNRSDANLGFSASHVTDGGEAHGSHQELELSLNSDSLPSPSGISVVGGVEASPIATEGRGALASGVTPFAALLSLQSPPAADRMSSAAFTRIHPRLSTSALHLASQLQTVDPPARTRPLPNPSAFEDASIARHSSGAQAASQCPPTPVRTPAWAAQKSGGRSADDSGGGGLLLAPASSEVNASLGSRSNGSGRGAADYSERSDNPRRRSDGGGSGNWRLNRHDSLEDTRTLMTLVPPLPPSGLEGDGDGAAAAGINDSRDFGSDVEMVDDDDEDDAINQSAGSASDINRDADDNGEVERDAEAWGCDTSMTEDSGLQHHQQQFRYSTSSGKRSSSHRRTSSGSNSNNNSRRISTGSNRTRGHHPRSSDVVTFDGSFVIVRELGQGGFSKVYEVADRQASGQRYAVKKGLRKMRSRRDRREQLREVRIYRRLRQLGGEESPHCLRYIRAWQEDGFVYIQMELCPGGSFTAALARVRAHEYMQQQLAQRAQSPPAPLSLPPSALPITSSNSSSTNNPSSRCSSATSFDGDVSGGGGGLPSDIVTPKAGSHAAAAGFGFLPGAPLPPAPPVPEATIWTFIAHVAAGLHHMHSRGFIHLDVKPDNVLLASSGCLKLGDLGLATEFAASRRDSTGGGKMRETAAGVTGLASAGRNGTSSLDASFATTTTSGDLNLTSDALSINNTSAGGPSALDHQGGETTGRSSRSSGGELPLTDDDDNEGDSRYMAAELLTSGLGSRAPPADIFSLGVSAWELAWGAEPPSDGEAWHDLREGRLQPPRPELARSKELLHLISLLLAPKPENRPTAAQLLTHPRIAAVLDPSARKDPLLAQALELALAPPKLSGMAAHQQQLLMASNPYAPQPMSHMQRVAALAAGQITSYSAAGPAAMASSAPVMASSRVGRSSSYTPDMTAGIDAALSGVVTSPGPAAAASAADRPSLSLQSPLRSITPTYGAAAGSAHGSGRQFNGSNVFQPQSQQPPLPSSSSSSSSSAAPAGGISRMGRLHSISEVDFDADLDMLRTEEQETAAHVTSLPQQQQGSNSRVYAPHSSASLTLSAAASAAPVIGGAPLKQRAPRDGATGEAASLTGGGRMSPPSAPFLDFGGTRAAHATQSRLRLDSASSLDSELQGLLPQAAGRPGGGAAASGGTSAELRAQLFGNPSSSSSSASASNELASVSNCSVTDPPTTMQRPVPQYPAASPPSAAAPAGPLLVSHSRSLPMHTPAVSHVASLTAASSSSAVAAASIPPPAPGRRQAGIASSSVAAPAAIKASTSLLLSGLEGTDSHPVLSSTGKRNNPGDAISSYSTYGGGRPSAAAAAAATRVARTLAFDSSDDSDNDGCDSDDGMGGDGKRGGAGRVGGGALTGALDVSDVSFGLNTSMSSSVGGGGGGGAHNTSAVVLAPACFTVPDGASTVFGAASGGQQQDTAAAMSGGFFSPSSLPPWVVAQNQQQQPSYPTVPAAAAFVPSNIPQPPPLRVLSSSSSSSATAAAGAAAGSVGKMKKHPREQRSSDSSAGASSQPMRRNNSYARSLGTLGRRPTTRASAAAAAAVGSSGDDGSASDIASSPPRNVSGGSGGGLDSSMVQASGSSMSTPDRPSRGAAGGPMSATPIRPSPVSRAYGGGGGGGLDSIASMMSHVPHATPVREHRAKARRRAAAGGGAAAEGVGSSVDDAVDGHAIQPELASRSHLTNAPSKAGAHRGGAGGLMTGYGGGAEGSNSDDVMGSPHWHAHGGAAPRVKRDKVDAPVTGALAGTASMDLPQMSHQPSAQGGAVERAASSLASGAMGAAAAAAGWMVFPPLPLQRSESDDMDASSPHAKRANTGPSPTNSAWHSSHFPLASPAAQAGLGVGSGSGALLAAVSQQPSQCSPAGPAGTRFEVSLAAIPRMTGLDGDAR